MLRVLPLVSGLSATGVSVAAHAAPTIHAASPVQSQAGSAIQWHQDGQASYYAPRWTGRRTSSGAVFDPMKLTAAHASLPLGTRILVTSEYSGESVVVTVNDRQPDHGNRIIDLSPAAARRLHMMNAGVSDVVISAAPEADAAASDNEVAEAPDDADDQDVAVPRHTRSVSHARHGLRHRHHARP